VVQVPALIVAESVPVANVVTFFPITAGYGCITTFVGVKRDLVSQLVQVNGSAEARTMRQKANVVMQPYPALIGKNVTTLATGTDSATITAGTWSTAVKKFGVTVESYSGNICDLVPTCPCPCPPGKYTTVLVLPVPSFAFSGRYTGEFRATTADSKSVVCIDYAFDIASGSKGEFIN